jgi:hypothetical protein
MRNELSPPYEIKSNYNGEYTRWEVPEGYKYSLDIAFADLRLLYRDETLQSNTTILKYLDQDGDMVLVNHEITFQLAVKAAIQHQSSVLRLFVEKKLISSLSQPLPIANASNNILTTLNDSTSLLANNDRGIVQSSMNRVISNNNNNNNSSKPSDVLMDVEREREREIDRLARLERKADKERREKVKREKEQRKENERKRKEEKRKEKERKHKKREKEKKKASKASEKEFAANEKQKERARIAIEKRVRLERERTEAVLQEAKERERSEKLATVSKEKKDMAASKERRDVNAPVVNHFAASTSGTFLFSSSFSSSFSSASSASSSSS